MSRFFLLLFSLLLFQFASAQDSEDVFQKKNKWLLESNFNLFGGLFSGGTGATIIFEDGEEVSSFGLELGRFTTENFAIKGRLSVLSSGGESLNTYGAALKYYVKGKIPIDLGFNIISGFGDSSSYANLSVGYAFELAPNIRFEPSLGRVFSEDDGSFLFEAGFAMFL
jgi:hypothetical protein